MGQSATPTKIGGRKLKTEGRAGVTFDRNHTMKSYPDEDTWTAEDLANQKRVADDVEKQIAKIQLKMGLAVCAVGILLAVAIHFLGKQ